MASILGSNSGYPFIRPLDNEVSDNLANDIVDIRSCYWFKFSSDDDFGICSKC